MEGLCVTYKQKTFRLDSDSVANFLQQTNFEDLFCFGDQLTRSPQKSTTSKVLT